LRSLLNRHILCRTRAAVERFTLLPPTQRWPVLYSLDYCCLLNLDCRAERAHSLCDSHNFSCRLGCELILVDCPNCNSLLGKAEAEKMRSSVLSASPEPLSLVSIVIILPSTKGRKLVLWGRRIAWFSIPVSFNLSNFSIFCCSCLFWLLFSSFIGFHLF